MNLLAILFPARCPVCRKVMGGNESRFCPECYEKLPREDFFSTGDACRIRFADGFVSPFRYEEPLRSVILRLKFSNKAAYAKVLGLEMAEAFGRFLEQAGVAPPRVVTYLPISRRRRLGRGYDQAELLAKAVGKALNLPVVTYLEKHRDTRAQSGMRDAAARKANVVGVYRLTKQGKMGTPGQSVLLVDDVCTTGATLGEAVKTLCFYAPAAVYCLTAANTVPEKSKKTVEKDGKISYNIE